MTSIHIVHDLVESSSLCKRKTGRLSIILEIWRRRSREAADFQEEDERRYTGTTVFFIVWKIEDTKYTRWGVLLSAAIIQD